MVRHLKRKHGKPRLRALRRVETPPGVQAQHDWFEVRVPLEARERRIQAPIGTLSHSRAKFCWVSEDQSQLAAPRQPIGLPGPNRRNHRRTLAKISRVLGLRSDLDRYSMVVLQVLNRTGSPTFLKRERSARMSWFVLRVIGLS